MSPFCFFLDFWEKEPFSHFFLLSNHLGNAYVERQDINIIKNKSSKFGGIVLEAICLERLATFFPDRSFVPLIDT